MRKPAEPTDTQRLVKLHERYGEEVEVEEVLELVVEYPRDEGQEVVARIVDLVADEVAGDDSPVASYRPRSRLDRLEEPVAKVLTKRCGLLLVTHTSLFNNGFSRKLLSRSGFWSSPSSSDAFFEVFWRFIYWIY